MPNLSMKQLDERLKVLEELERVEGAPPEWLDDVLLGVITALRQMRQQGAYTLSNELEAKYFPDGGVEEIGDALTITSGLKRSGGD